MVYPFLSNREDLRERLIKGRLFVATYWLEVLKREEITHFEKKMVSLNVPIPVDQRYGLEEMEEALNYF